MYVPDIFVSRWFEGVESINNLPPDRRMTVSRLILVSQEAAANQRQGFYQRYIRALAGAGLSSSLIHHETKNSDSLDPNRIPSEALLIFCRAIAILGDKFNRDALYGHSGGASAEQGHVTQFGDWLIDKDLKKAIEELPSNEDIARAGVEFEKIHDILDISDVRYKARIDDNPNENSTYPAITASRVRPVADLALRSIRGTTHRLEIVKRSTFAVSVDDGDVEVVARAKSLIREEDHKGSQATRLGRSIIERAIEGYRNSELSTDTFPGESIYFAILRK